MASKAVPLVFHCKTPSGWKRLPVAFHPNGKLRPRYATVGGKLVKGKMVGGKQVEYPEGHYEVRCYVEGKRVWCNVGEDARTALAEQNRLARQLTTKIAAAASGDKIVDAPGRIDLAARAKVYHARQITRKKHRHALRFKREMAEFLACTGVTHADQLTEEIILGWYDRLQEGGNSDRTILNKHCMVFGFLKWCGVTTKPLAPDGPPSVIMKKPKKYSPEELGVFMASLKKQYHRVVYGTFMMTGMREQEVMYLERDNFDFKNLTVSVLSRDDNGFLIKDRAERTIPLDGELAVMMQEWIARHPGRYVFGTSKGKVNGELLPTLKRLARRAGLNCGHCETCRKNAHRPEMQQCSRRLLKTLRSTWITAQFRAGYDAVTIMSWSGHEDFKTIQMYAVPSEAKDVQERFNRIVWTVPPVAA